MKHQMPMFEPTGSSAHDDRCSCPGCAGLCQDDYEYYTQTGAYAPQSCLHKQKGTLFTMKKQARRTQPQASTRGQGSLVYHKPLKDMTPDEVSVWVQGIRERLERKMQRERAYLDRRASRGVRTPTDEAYEYDLLLEAELITLLDELAQEAQTQIQAQA